MKKKTSEEKIRYIYPVLSKPDLFMFRFLGPGLGNLLFVYFNAYIYAKKMGAKLIWPTWASIKIGPWVRHEMDKRFYGNLFLADENVVAGADKVKCLLFDSRAVEKVTDDRIRLEKELAYRKEFRSHLLSITRKKWKQPIPGAGQNIHIHVRLGDFSRNYQELAQVNPGDTGNISIPVQWYQDVIEQINEKLGACIQFTLFSDGSDKELKPLLKIPNVHRFTTGSSIGDLLALSRCKCIIASGSTFSLWARFLGNCSAITYKNMLIQKVCDQAEGFEYDTAGVISAEIIEKLERLYYECVK